MAHHTSLVRRSRAGGIALLLSLSSASVFASGFALIEQSVSGAGNAHAGASARAEDASTIFFNPAGMTRLEGTQFTAAAHVVLPSAKFSGSGTFNAGSPVIAMAPGLGGTSSGGGNGGDGGENGLIPNLYYTRDINAGLKFGLGVNAPFGLGTEYDADWAGRYHAIKSELLTVNLNPSLAFKVDDHASVGVGVSALYAKGELTNAVDYALLDVLGLIPGGPYLGGAPAGTQALDGKAVLEGNDWGFGFNFGVMLEPTEQTRLGLAYRSKVELELEGDVRITGPLPTTTDTAKLEIALPDTLSLSAYHEVDPQWAVMADITWTQWSRLDALNVKRGNGSTSITPLQWKNTARYAVGVSYKRDAAWIYRAGLAYDETPVPSAELRTPRVPDNDRTWLTFGASYRHSNQLSFDIAYAHLFVADTAINSADAYAPALYTGLHRLTGEYEADTDIISAQANWKFN